jgi:hypothetical protein
MELLKLFKTKRIWAIILIFLLFILFITSLFIRDTFPSFYVFSIFFMILVFIFSQYLNFEYKLFILFALILFIFLFLLIAVKGRSGLAESFGNYIILLLVFTVIGYYLDNLKQILGKKGKNRLYKTVFSSILFAFLVFSIVIFVKDFYNNIEYAAIIKKGVLNSAEAVKNNYLRVFNKERYYGKVDYVMIDSKKYEQQFVIGIDFPKEDSNVSGNVTLKGWAIETNSINNTGIDRIEFFLDGKPGDGKFLGKYLIVYKGEAKTIELVNDLYSNFYDRQPLKDELSLWAMNLEWNIMSYNEVISSFINNSKILEGNLSEEEYVSILYRIVLSREVDGEGLKFWIDKLNSGTSRNDVLNDLLNSDELKVLSENYYKKVKIKETDLDLVRKDVGDKYGKQFFLSGFSFIFDSTKFKNGEHNLYVYAHSTIFGWDHKKVDFFIEN